MTLAQPSPERPMIEVRNLHTGFQTEEGLVQAVRGVDLAIGAREILCLVGESGSGKSVTAHSIMRLLSRNAVVSGGEIHFDGRDLLALQERQMRQLRGRRIAMVFQEPMTSLNPVRRVGDQVAESLRTHLGLSRRAAAARALELFEKVGIPDAEARLRVFPQALSGGMRQRVMIAMALACEPDLIIADEPTTALDVTIQAQVLDLLHRLCRETGTSLLLITHDLGVVSEMADRVAVMYAGQIVETAPVETFFTAPKHPYSAALMRSIPRLDQRLRDGERLYSIEGPGAPQLIDPPQGCAFCARCPEAFGRCATEQPRLAALGGAAQARCFLHEQ